MCSCCPDLNEVEGELSACKVIGNTSKLTVSKMPDALGLPSMRTGRPSMYLDNFLSRGSNVWL